MLLSRVGILNLGRVTGLSCLRTTPASQRYGALLTKPGITGPTLTYVPHFLKLKRRPSRRYIRNRAYPSWKGNSTVEDEITSLRVKKAKIDVPQCIIMHLCMCVRPPGANAARKYITSLAYTWARQAGRVCRWPKPSRMSWAPLRRCVEMRKLPCPVLELCLYTRAHTYMQTQV